MAKRIENVNDIVGRSFGKLTVLHFSGKKAGKLYYRCQCDCGNIKEVYRYNLLRGSTTSCHRCKKPRIVEENGYYRYYCASGGSFIFDSEDMNTINSRLWHISAQGYVIHTQRYSDTEGERKDKSKVEWLHRLLVGAGDDEYVDHMNGNKLDNRKENLRIVTLSQNNSNQRLRSDNTTGYKGVCYSNRLKKYTAELRSMGKKHYLGAFDTMDEAACAYDAAAREIHGAYAAVNFPQKDERGCREVV